MLKGKQDERRKFGGKLCSMRRRCRMTQKELADALDIDYRQISRYETGEAVMGAMLYDKMLNIVGMWADDSQTQEAIQQFSTLSHENRKKALEYMSLLNMSQG